MLKFTKPTKDGGVALGIMLNATEIAALREDHVIAVALDDVAERARLTELVIVPGGATDYDSMERLASHIGPETEVNRG